MLIVPNEWLIEMLLGTPEEQRKVHECLDILDRGGHLMAIRRRGILAQKIQSSPRDRFARAKRLYLMLYDAAKVRLVEEEGIEPLPQELARRIPNDDKYLVETALAVRPCLLVTTDEPLRNILIGCQVEEVEVYMLDEYLAQAAGG